MHLRRARMTQLGVFPEGCLIEIECRDRNGPELWMPAIVLAITATEAHQSTAIVDLLPANIDSYTVTFLGGTEPFDLEPTYVRAVVMRGNDGELTVVEGCALECWYANDAKYYPAVVDATTDRGTALVTYQGFDESTEVPLEYLNI